MIMKSVTITCLLLVLLTVTACGQSEATQTEIESVAVDGTNDQVVAQAAATDTSVPPTKTAVPPTETVEPTATMSPTATATFTPTPEVVAGSCLDCHGDKQTLIDTAAIPEEPESSESSGVG